MENDDLIEQSDGTPTRKLTAATLGSATAAVFIGLAVWLFGVDQPPAGFEAGLGTVLAFLLGYGVKERAR